MSQQSEQNINIENLDDNSCSATQWESMKKEVLEAVDEKFDVEAVAQMVEHLDFSQKLNGSLQRTFQGLQVELRQKDQMIQYLQGRLDNLELDIALLKRIAVSPSPFPHFTMQSQQVAQATNFVPKVTTPKQPPSQNQTDSNFASNTANIQPPDFSALRQMVVPEPTNKFIPKPKENSEQDISDVTENSDEQ